MSSIVLNGDTSGAVTVAVPSVAGTNTITLPAGTGTAAVQGVSTNIVSGTAQATTSGTSFTFTGIPSWVKRITLIFKGVQTSGSAAKIVQIGSGSITTTGYVSTGSYIIASGSGVLSSTSSFTTNSTSSADTIDAIMTIVNFTGNTWVESYSGKQASATTCTGGGDVTLSGVLDRLVVSTANGTDTFTAGSINILYE